MNVYTILKYVNKFKHPRLKLLGIYLFHIFGRRYIGIFFDPVLGCNIRCKMCHFSDEEQRKKMKGVMTLDEMTKFGNAFFHRALKLQIGCGAEPTLHKDLPKLIALGKEKKVPWVSITTNANLLSDKMLTDCLEAGLDEITISLHGVKKETYEFMMDKASHDVFLDVLYRMSEAKKKYNFSIRINYTINEDNVDELANFFDVYGNIDFDVIQLRPIANFGNTTYHNFSYARLIEKYDETIQKVKDEAIKRNIRCLVSSKEQMLAPDNKNSNSVIYEGVYYYFDPKLPWRGDFDLGNETFESYCRRKGIGWRLFKSIFQSKRKMNKKKRQLNYEIS
ncbi:radical SAM protein [Dysgonomonas sp. 520]|uniref:radical SAM protein n=1 Tax=Dysgonomonas sp. 520 TaxID=2302931 RepID=UPI0013D0BC21|nr:radical SAM protein [Dysgonomonas sp. 520]NDW08970.1 radical SAM protein [Dysgonomonas sp. 520]